MSEPNKPKSENKDSKPKARKEPKAGKKTKLSKKAAKKAAKKASKPKSKARKKHKDAERLAAKIAAFEAGVIDEETVEAPATPAESSTEPEAAAVVAAESSTKPEAAEVVVSEAQPSEPVERSTESSPEDDGESFADFGLDPRLVQAVEGLGFQSATPIQAAAIPALLDGGDLIGSARTGSGKTAAFGLPLLHRIADGEGLSAVVLTPTRELCMQVATALRSYAQNISGFSVATIYGGAPYPPQIRALRDGARVVVGTPGRVIDHLQRGTLKLADVKVFVLDEADQMLQMGFIDEVNQILGATSDDRQIALFSATMPPAIKRIAETYLTEPRHVRPESPKVTVDHIEQRFMVVPNNHKLEALQRFLRSTTGDAMLIFARTRASCADVAEALQLRGWAVEPLHGDMQQAARERVIGKLRAGKTKMVVGTDVAARGLDVDNITHVINLDLPMDSETYVHRIGRTARAGREGLAVSFVTPGERRKMSLFARHLNADIQQMEVPSDAAIAARERGRLVELLQATPSDEDGAPALLAEVAVKTGWDVEEIALRALRAWATSEHIPLDASPDDKPPKWAQPKKRPERGSQSEGFAELMIHAGRRDGLRPGDIVASLTNNFDIPPEAIGRITLVASRAFVGMAPEHLARLCAETDAIPLRGDEVPVEANDRPAPVRGRGPKKSFGGRGQRFRHGKGRPDQGRGGGRPERKRGGGFGPRRRTKRPNRDR